MGCGKDEVTVPGHTGKLNGANLWPELSAPGAWLLLLPSAPRASHPLWDWLAGKEQTVRREQVKA